MQVQRTTAAFPFRPSKFLHCRNPAAVQSKLDRILADGPSNLHFISDFDMTLTTYWVHGKRNISSHGLVTRWSKISPNFKRETDELYNKYYPIEISTEMTLEEKVPFMVQWWQRTHELIVSTGMTEYDLREMIRETPIPFRSGVRTAIDLCNRLRIPFLVFSAGIADLIEEVLRFEQLLLPAMHVISNRMVFDSHTRRVVAFSEPIVHVFNKNEFTGLLTGMTEGHLHGSAEQLHVENEAALVGANNTMVANDVETKEYMEHVLTAEDSVKYRQSLAEYKKMIADRKNVILMGDSLGDIQMGQGVKHDTLLSIGFLNQFQQLEDGTWVDAEQNQGPPTDAQVIKKNVEAYLSTFDVVISADSGLEVFVNILLEQMLQNTIPE